MNMEVDHDNNSEEAQQSQSLQNTEYNQLFGDRDENSSDRDDYWLTSYQKPTLPVPPSEKNEEEKESKRSSSYNQSKQKNPLDYLKINCNVETLVQDLSNTLHGPTY